MNHMPHEPIEYELKKGGFCVLRAQFGMSAPVQFCVAVNSDFVQKFRSLTPMHTPNHYELI